MEYFIAVNNWLSKRMFIFVLGAMGLGLYFQITDSPALRTVVTVLFSYMTFITALGTSFKQFFQVMRKPLVPVIILACVHLAMPVVAWLLGIFFYPGDSLIRLGYLVGATIPIGVTSVIWTSIYKGNVSVSLVAVMLDTLLVPVILPLYFAVIIGQTVHIDYLAMIKELLLMITGPSVAGMALHDLTKGRITNFAKSIGGVTSKIGFYFIILINAAVVLPQIGWGQTMLKLILTTLLIVVLGFIMGHVCSFCLPVRTRENVVAMVYNIGMRNNAFGIVLALTYFPTRVAAPMTLFMLLQQPLAALAPLLFKQDDSLRPDDPVVPGN